jgi:hypothetical protein
VRLDTRAREIIEVTEKKSRMDAGADSVRGFPPSPAAVLPSKISILEIHIFLMITACDTIYCVRQVETFVETFRLRLQGGKVKAQNVHNSLCQTELSVCETTRRHVPVLTLLINLF